MRTIAEIKKSMTDGIMADPNLVQRLSLDTTKSWESQVSAVSVLNLIIYIVAVGHHIMERMFEQFKADVEGRIAAAYPGSVSWLWNRALEYQHDTSANIYLAEHGVYESVDESKRVVRFAAVAEKYNAVTVKVSGAGYAPLTDEQLTGFTAYMNTLKFAGVHLNVSSIESDDLTLTLRVWRDRLVMPEEDDAVIGGAVRSYLDAILYGGVFNKTRLIDALRGVAGITDAVVEGCVFEAHDTDGTETVLAGQNYEATAGHINLKTLTVNYE